MALPALCGCRELLVFLEVKDASLAEVGSIDAEKLHAALLRFPQNTWRTILAVMQQLGLAVPVDGARLEAVDEWQWSGGAPSSPPAAAAAAAAGPPPASAPCGSARAHQWVTFPPATCALLSKALAKDKLQPTFDGQTLPQPLAPDSPKLRAAEGQVRISDTHFVCRLRNGCFVQARRALGSSGSEGGREGGHEECTILSLYRAQKFVC